MNINDNLIKNYLPQSSFDEFLNQDHPKAHWHAFIQEFTQLSPEKLERAIQEIRRRLKDNGVTYNLHTETSEQKRDWLLDIMPNIIPEAEWGMIELAIEQRAQLFKLILEDCYGPQSLIKEGFVPAEIIFGHRGYLLPAHGLKPNLSLFATDLARGLDGKLWVVSDRTQVPSGMGYALENRTVMTAVVPQFFQADKISRLANFFRNVQTSFAALSPRQISNPSIVLLSPGSNSETYFEHAYLASYLGYTLVQGDDLAVRNGKVYLKTLQGLEQVDVVIRRVDDDYCDPLELRGDSRLGSPGLLEAARRGNVVIANSLGSSLLENPGLLPFLPSIAKHLLGQDLMVDSVATWWCGHSQELNHVLERLNDLVIKRIDRKNKSQTVFGSRLSQAELASLEAQIKAEPHLFVGQEILEHATSPVLISQPQSTRLEPRHTLLRGFAVAFEDGFSVMPGGLSRSSVEKGNMIINNRMGSMSKDTWVLGTNLQPHQSLWNTQPSMGRDLHPSALASRTADNLFWVGRYAERSEAIARLLRLLIDLLTDSETNAVEEKVLVNLLNALASVSQAGQSFGSEEASKEALDITTELLNLCLDKNRVGSLPNTLGSMLNAAYATKSAWSSDSWRVLVSTEELWQDLAKQKNLSLEDLQTPLNTYITSLMAFAGLNAESMSQGLGWRFLDMGRRLERAKLIAKLINSSLSGAINESEVNNLLEKLLSVSENIITYRRNYRSQLNLSYALELILFDEHNPRALAFQLKMLEQHLLQLPQSKQRYPLSQAEKCILEASTKLRLADSIELSQANEKLERKQLEGLLNELIYLLDGYTNALSERYFSHTLQSHQLNNKARPLSS